MRVRYVVEGKGGGRLAFHVGKSDVVIGHVREQKTLLVIVLAQNFIVHQVETIANAEPGREAEREGEGGTVGGREREIERKKS